MIKRIINSIIFSILTFIFILNTYALTLNNNYNNSAKDLVDVVLGGNLSSTSANKVGTVYTFSNGLKDIGIDSGIILDTSGRVTDNNYKDSDLNSLMDYPYGGHTSSLEFSMISTGKLLNFDYVFASREFDQPVRYNDIFGLFVSVNNGPYENIAKIKKADNTLVPVNIFNLKGGVFGNEVSGNPVFNTEYSLFYAKNIQFNEKVNGVSKIFNAQKKVNIGDTVKIKFVIADVSDTSYDSYVMIEGKSLSFEPQPAEINYQKEVLSNLDPIADYIINDGEQDYEITSDVYGEIPLASDDYDFFGKEIQIGKKDDDLDLEPQTIIVGRRMDSPSDVEVPTGTPSDIYLEDIEITENDIKINGDNSQQYSLDKIDWKNPDNNGYVNFDNLQPNTEYTIYTRYKATDTTPASEISSGSTVITQNMARNLEYNIFNYDGIYDGDYHYSYVTSDDNVEIRYSKTLYGTYKSNLIKFKEPGTYTVYYCITKENYYPAYGKLTVNIRDIKANIFNTTNKDLNFNKANLDETSTFLRDKIKFTNEERSLLGAGKNINIYLKVTDITEIVNNEDNNLINKNLKSGERVGMYLDISLFKMQEGSEEKSITETNKPVNISFQIPEFLTKKGRTFSILRIHDNKIDNIDYKIKDSLIMFKTDKFSTYTITYTDKDLSKKSDSIFNPSTGDNIMYIVIVLAIALLGMCFLVILKKINGNKKIVQKNIK